MNIKNQNVDFIIKKIIFSDNNRNYKLIVLT